MWEEYCVEAQARGLKGYSRSHFFGLLKGHLKGPRQEPEMRFNYEPGVWMMSDFSGKTLPLQTRVGLQISSFWKGGIPADCSDVGVRGIRFNPAVSLLPGRSSR